MSEIPPQSGQPDGASLAASLALRGILTDPGTFDVESAHHAIYHTMHEAFGSTLPTEPDEAGTGLADTVRVALADVLDHNFKFVAGLTPRAAVELGAAVMVHALTQSLPKQYIDAARLRAAEREEDAGVEDVTGWLASVQPEGGFLVAATDATEIRVGVSRSSGEGDGKKRRFR